MTGSILRDASIVPHSQAPQGDTPQRLNSSARGAHRRVDPAICGARATDGGG